MTNGIKSNYISEKDKPPLASADLRAAFVVWLNDGNAKKYSVDALVSCFDKISDYAIERKVSSVRLWANDKPEDFKAIFNKLLGAKLLRITNKSARKVFIVAGQLYLRFLNEGAGEANIANSKMTIKEAAVRVMETERRTMKAHEIYDKIIERGLYTFGARNPINVVRTTIEYACDNSNFTNRDKNPLFVSVTDIDGNKEYGLISNHVSEVAWADISKSGKETDLPSRGCSIIWNAEIENNFALWLENGTYAPRTAYSYKRNMVRIFRSFDQLAKEAAQNGGSALEVVRRFTNLLNENDDYVELNKLRHNQCRASLAAFEKYLANSVGDFGVENQISASGQIAEKAQNRNTLDDIVDLDEGIAGIRQIIEAHFQALYNYSNIGIVWSAAQSTLSMFLNDNAINSVDDLWEFLHLAFADDFLLDKPHIWKDKPAHPQGYVGLVVNIARQFDGLVSREQIDEYFVKIQQGTIINRVILQQKLLMFYASRKFILTEVVSLTPERCSRIKLALDKIFANGQMPFIIIRDIADEWFSLLPQIRGGYPWTALLLQEVLRLKPNIGYNVIYSGMSGQALDTLGVAIVPEKSSILTFADVAHNFCVGRNLLTKKLWAEELRLMLRDAGMIEGNELIYNLHKALQDHRFAFTDENKMVKILEK